uniref:(northern house mosquito) hypothetical protein n=1 Tax=Culex pipiens TaxID=7175 RepID=A0A8D8PHL8_CULPI
MALEPSCATVDSKQNSKCSGAAPASWSRHQCSARSSSPLRCALLRGRPEQETKRILRRRTKTPLGGRYNKIKHGDFLGPDETTSLNGCQNATEQIYFTQITMYNQNINKLTERHLSHLTLVCTHPPVRRGVINNKR